MDFEKQHYSLSLKQKLKIIYASCCNFCDAEEDDDIQKPLERSSSDKRHFLTSWLKSELAHIISSKQGRNRRSNSSEFKYDPFSYALNFEDDDSHLDEYPLRNFSSRLPPSPVKQFNNNFENVVDSAQKSSWI